MIYPFTSICWSYEHTPEVFKKGYEGIHIKRYQIGNAYPCQDMKPIFNSLADKYKSQASFGIADRDSIPQLRADFNIRIYPRVYVFSDGQLVSQHEVASTNYQQEIMKPLGPYLQS